MSEVNCRSGKELLVMHDKFRKGKYAFGIKYSKDDVMFFQGGFASYQEAVKAGKSALRDRPRRAQ